MADNNLIFIENLEWFDESGKQLVHRLPETGSAEIKWGAQLISTLWSAPRVSLNVRQVRLGKFRGCKVLFAMRGKVLN